MPSPAAARPVARSRLLLSNARQRSQPALRLPAHASERMHHVILSTYGEPTAARFADQLRYSWRILLGLTRTVADIPKPILPLIALSRARTRVSSWRREAYSSPLEPITVAQRDGLQRGLDRAAPDGWRVHVAYEFRDPTLATVVASLPAGDRVFVVPMYAADSAFTHQLARDAAAILGPRVSVLDPLPIEEQARLHADHVRRELARLRVPASQAALVLAAHGTLVDPPRPYLTGERETRAMADRITQMMAGEFATTILGWLNHSRGGTWTSPAMEEALAALRAQGCREVVYYPFGFLADNAETELEGRVALRAAGFERATHLRCLNDSEALIDTLLRAVLDVGGHTNRADRLPGPSARQ
jgi:protoheme ferro-lyase